MDTQGCPRYVEPLRGALEAAGAGPVALVETHISCLLLDRYRPKIYKRLYVAERRITKES